MKRFWILSCLVVPAVMLLWLIGCGGSSTNNDLVAGDTTDADYQFVSELMGENILDQLSKSIDLSFVLMDSVPGPPASGKNLRQQFATQMEEDILLAEYTYSYTNGWHVFSFAGSITDGYDTVDVSGVDSVMFLVLGDPMQYPDSTADEMRVRAKFDVSDRAGWVSMSSDHSLDVDGITPAMDQPVTISGSAQDDMFMSFEDSTGSCDFEMHTNLNVASLTGVVEGTDCPTSGSVDATASLDMVCLGTGENPGDQLDVSGTWTMSASFGNGVVNLTYSDGSTYWQSTEDCSGTTEPLAVWIPRGF